MLQTLTYIGGFVGAGAILLGSLVTAFAFTGPAGENYSPLNHYVSELGHTAMSRLALFFNICVIIGGIALGIFMIGLGLHFDSGIKWAFLVIGLIDGVLGALVGVFPMNVNKAHFPIAILFFLLAFVYVLIFSIFLPASDQATFPAALAIAGAPMVICSLILLITGGVYMIQGTNALDLPPEGRADVLLITTAEWLSVISLIIWVIACQFT